MAIAALTLFLLGFSSGAVACWLGYRRRLAAGHGANRGTSSPPWRPSADMLDLIEQRRILIQACQAGAARLRAIDAELWEQMDDALIAADAPPAESAD